MILILDNFDSFTYNLEDYFLQCGVKSKVLRNNTPLKIIKKYPYKGIVLSPGPEIPQKAGSLMEVIDYYHKELPILGICLGHQAIGQYFGSSLKKAQKPMHGKLSLINISDDYMFNGLNNPLQVVRYHSLVIDNIPINLSITAQTEAGEIMAIKHTNFPIRGLQFHPEAFLTISGMNMLKNWINFNNIVQ